MKEKILNYIGMDGMLHILCSIVVMGIVGLFAPLWVAIIATAAVGLAKEFVWDKWMGRGTFDKKDLLCDCVGIIIGCL